MPISYTVDNQQRVLTFTLSGTVTGVELIAALTEAARQAGPGRCRVLSDHRALTAAATTGDVEDVVTGLTAHREMLAGSRCAVVVGRPASYGMMRMFSTLAERIPLGVEVFEDMDAARRWLDMAPDTAP